LTFTTSRIQESKSCAFGGLLCHAPQRPWPGLAPTFMQYGGKICAKCVSLNSSPATNSRLGWIDYVSATLSRGQPARDQAPAIPASTASFPAKFSQSYVNDGTRMAVSIAFWQLLRP
jgi:hypothetical protein